MKKTTKQLKAQKKELDRRVDAVKDPVEAMELTKQLFAETFKN